ncbi:MAG: protoheme IX farnesyltransferase [Ignavibacteria bacterium]|nr:heme o synthase [Ignavibacteria bacterium]MCC7158927.1 protoheme IX farnesyltransferase [Ignavibacteria bacterium]
MKRSSAHTGIIAQEQTSLSVREFMKVFTELTKFRITALVSFTTGLGYILGARELSFTLFYVIAGIFLLAAASSSLNHWQERQTDALMERTKHRPIPSGRIEPSVALYLSLGLLFSGSVVLLMSTNFTTFLVGIFTFLWYNGVYTPLKRKTAFAIIPGALVGALPPVAGWTAAGGDITNSAVIMIAAYFFIWQIPHFWLLLMLYGSDYEKGGFPTLNRIFSAEQIKRITFMWLVGNILTAMLIPLFVYINYMASFVLLAVISAWMFYVSVRFLNSRGERKDIRNTFLAINFYTLLLITILAADKLIKVF